MILGLGKISRMLAKSLGNDYNVKVVELNVDDEENDPEGSLQDMMKELELKKIPHFFISHNGEKIANIQTSNPDTLESFLDEYLPQNE